MTRHINGSRTAASASLLHLMANESKSVSILDKVTQPSLMAGPQQVSDPAAKYVKISLKLKPKTR